MHSKYIIINYAFIINVIAHCILREPDFACYCTFKMSPIPAKAEISLFLL